jgi:AMP phosphorylase
MDISFKKSEIIRMTDKNGACLVRNEGLNLAPANDRIIKVSSPLGMEPYARMISSIMAKNYAMGITHCLIDIPMGPTAKVASMIDAERVARHFREIGEALDIKMDVQITEANQPVGRGIGAALQAREALRVLQNHPDQSSDLAMKAIFLAARLILLCGLAQTQQKAERMVMKQLENGEAWEKMSQIIKAQNGHNPDIKADEIKLGKLVYEIKAEKKLTITDIDMKYLNMIVRILGAPAEYKAGIRLSKKLGDTVKKGEVMYVLYSESETKMARAKEMLKEKEFYSFK